MSCGDVLFDRDNPHGCSTLCTNHASLDSTSNNIYYI